MSVPDVAQPLSHSSSEGYCERLHGQSKEIKFLHFKSDANLTSIYVSLRVKI